MRTSRAAAIVLGALGALYLAAMAALVVLEPWLLFPRPAVPESELAQLARRWDAQEVRLRSRDGTPLYGWRLGQGDRLVVLFSGNGSTVGWQDERYRTLLDAGYAVLHVNYRGYPGSGGTPSEVGLVEDGLATWREALGSHPAQQVVLLGKSLGGGVAMGVAEALSQLPPGQRPRALVLESTFTSAADVGALQYPVLPVHWLMRNPFSSLARAPHVQIPAVVIHGGRDELIPPQQAEDLTAALPDATYVAAPLAFHNDVLWNEPEALTALEAIFSRSE